MSSFWPTPKLPILTTLGEFRDMIQGHIGSDITARTEPLLSGVLNRLDSLLGTHVTDNTVEAADRKKTTDWGLLLKDTVAFLEEHKDLIQDGSSQALKINEDIRVIIDVAQSQASMDGVNDKEYLVGISPSEIGEKRLTGENSDGTYYPIGNIFT